MLEEFGLNFITLSIRLNPLRRVISIIFLEANS